MVGFFLALALVVVMMLAYAGVVQTLVDPDSVLWRLVRRLRVDRQVRREVADVDREHASLVDEHRFTP